jgi:hypothetical protein
MQAGDFHRQRVDAGRYSGAALQHHVIRRDARLQCLEFFA